MNVEIGLRRSDIFMLISCNGFVIQMVRYSNICFFNAYF